jgi:nitrite reductase/ring-hydroxylating ferredoxin subunit
LSEGVVGDGQVVCPMHGHRFNLADGSGSEPNECVRVFRVKNADGEIRLCMP